MRRGRRLMVVAVGVLLLAGCGSGITEEDLAGVRSEAADTEEQLRAQLEDAEAAAAEAASEAADLAGEAAGAAADEVAEVQSELEAVRARLEAAESERDAAEDALTPQEELDARASELEDLVAELDARASELDGLAAEVEAREAAVTGTEEAIAASTFGNGTFIVGQDIPAGRYRSDGSGSSCYWERNTADGGGIIDNHFGSSPAVATVREGEIFRTESCGTWSPA